MDEECGRSGIPDAARRIVGGSATKPHQYPWLVALMRRGKLHCGGALITRKHLLTAGHCIAFGVHYSELEALVGMHDRRDAGTRSVRVIDGLKHPDFESNVVRDVNDIAVLELDADLTFDHTIQPICLPPKNLKLSGDLLTVAGWGKTRAGSGSSSRFLLQALVKPISARVCTRASVYRENVDRDSMLCAYSTGKDACQGDSGGPLFTVKDGQWYQVGIVSWGIDCAKPDYPGVYTVVAKYVDWIRETTAGTKYCTSQQ